VRVLGGTLIHALLVVVSTAFEVAVESIVAEENCICSGSSSSSISSSSSSSSRSRGPKAKTVEGAGNYL